MIEARPGSRHTEPSGWSSSNRNDVGTETEAPLIAEQIWEASDAFPAESWPGLEVSEVSTSSLMTR